MAQSEPYLSLVIPAYNEAGIIQEAVLAALLVLDAQQMASYEVVVVDDGSSDATLSVLRTIEARHSAVRVVAHERNRGLGAALSTGFQHCRGEVLTWIPGDGQFDLREVLEGLPLMREYDIVVALRTGAAQSSRIVITWCFHLLTWTLFRFNAANMCGIYIIRRSVLEEIRPQAQNIFYNLEIPILCVKHGKRLAKIQLRLLPRLGGVSKVSNVRTLSRNLIEMARVWFSFAARCGATGRRAFPRSCQTRHHRYGDGGERLGQKRIRNRAKSTPCSGEGGSRKEKRDLED